MIIISCNKQSLNFRHQVPLVKITRISLNKRSLMSMSRIAKHSLGLNNVLPSTRHLLIKRTPTILQQRDLRIAAGKIKDKQPSSVVPSTTSENPEVVQSDQSGFHKVVIIDSCTNNQCHKKYCDTEHESVCSIKQSDFSNCVSELAGGLTHKLPAGKNGIVLGNYDVNGETKNGSQKLVTEKTTVPVDRNKFKEDPKASEYVQQTETTKKIVQALPLNSPLCLKETSHCDTANDD